MYLKELLNEILNINIEDLKIDGIEKYNNVLEYNFQLLKIEVMLKNKTKMQMFLKIIKKGKVKESIFCYSALLYKDFYNKEDFRVKIQEAESNSYKNKIILYLEKESLSLENKLEINLFDLDKLREMDNINIMKNIKIFNDFNNILLVGIKYL